jgi:hypothetical protein
MVQNGEEFVKTNKGIPVDEQIGIGERSERFSNNDYKDRRGKTVSAGNQKKNLAGSWVQPFGQ